MRSLAARFASNALALVAGALIVIGVFAFGPTAYAWITFGLATLAVVAVLAAFAMPQRGALPRVIDVLLVLAGSWTILASRVFAGSANRWLDFAGGVAIAALGAVGLIVHELLLERSLEAMRRRAAVAAVAAAPAPPTQAPRIARLAGSEAAGARD